MKKFIIVDANSVNNSWVMGGSTNWTDPSNLLNDYNNIIFFITPFEFNA